MSNREENQRIILIIGSGGHSASVGEILELGAAHSEMFVAEKVGSEYELMAQNEKINEVVIGIGENHRRKMIARKIQELRPDIVFPTLIHPDSIVSKSAKVGAGTVIMAGAIVNPRAVIGSHCVVNTGAIIEHDCILGDFSSVATGAALGGRCTIGEGAWVGLGASVIHNIAIGANTVVGAGAVVVQNLPDHVLAYGTPATVIRHRREEEAFLI